LRLLFRLWLLPSFWEVLFYGAYRRKKLREQERRDNITKALCYDFNAAHGFPTKVDYSRNITEAEEDLHKERIDFVNTRAEGDGQDFDVPRSHKAMSLELTDEQTEALIRELSQIVQNDPIQQGEEASVYGAMGL
jgi:hypothetical protein